MLTQRLQTLAVRGSSSARIDSSSLLKPSAFATTPSIPIAVAANSLRIVGTGLLVQYWDPDKAQGFFHEFSGWLIFVVSLGMLYLLHAVLRIFWPEEGAQL